MNGDVMVTMAYMIPFPPHYRWITLAVIAAVVLGPPLWTFVLRYGVAPLKIRRTQWKERDPSHARVELPAMPPDTAGAFAAAARQLAALGFRATGHVVHQSASKTGQHGYVSVWVHEAHRNIAQVIATRTPRAVGGGVKIVALATFRAEYPDRSAIITSNSPSPGVFPRDPKVDSVVCPHVNDLTLLYDLHQRRVQRDAGGRAASIAQAADPVQYLGDEWRYTFERLSNVGIYRWSEANQRYEPTLRGAYYMTYRLLRPFKQMSLAARDRKADRVLAELGYGSLANFRTMQRPESIAGV